MLAFVSSIKRKGKISAKDSSVSKCWLVSRSKRESALICLLLCHQGKPTLKRPSPPASPIPLESHIRTITPLAHTAVFLFSDSCLRKNSPGKFRIGNFHFIDESLDTAGKINHYASYPFSLIHFHFIL